MATSFTTDGVSWQLASTATYGALTDVAASASDDVWIVNGGSFILHWNGQAWLQTSGEPGDSVAAKSPVDVWTASSIAGGSQDANLMSVGHFDGTGWSVVPIPSPPRWPKVVDLVSISATGDVWAVGQSGRVTKRPMILLGTCA